MPAPKTPPAGDLASPVVHSDELFAGRHEITILHKGVSYRLRITRQDKLILTK
jgi:hemin uptake protein HemP